MPAKKKVGLEPVEPHLADQSSFLSFIGPPLEKGID